MSLLLLLNQPPYHKALLKTANRLLEDHQPAVALIVAHMACEIYAEQVMAQAFKKRGAADLEDAVTDLLSSNNLANDRVRRLYTALTDDQIQDTPFWKDFKESATLRNQAIHHGARISPEQARTSCEVAGKIVTHLDSVTKRLRES